MQKGFPGDLMKNYIALLLLCVTIACQSEKKEQAGLPPAPPPPPQGPAGLPPNIPPPPLLIPGPILVKEFMRNEENADKMYKGKSIAIIGEVEKTAPDQSVIIKADGNPYTVQFYFSDETRKESLARLKPGKKVIIKGTLEGRDKNLIVKNSKVERAD
jgi:hypothetical protein